MGFVDHAGQKDRDYVVEVLKHQLRNDLEDILDDLYQFVGVELGNALHVWTFSLEHPDHRDVQDRTQLHKGAFEQECDAWRLPDLFLHQLNVILQGYPAPCDVRNDLNVSQSRLLDVYDLHHMVQVVSGVQQVSLDLDL